MSQNNQSTPPIDWEIPSNSGSSPLANVNRSIPSVATSVLKRTTSSINNNGNIRTPKRPTLKREERRKTPEEIATILRVKLGPNAAWWNTANNTPKPRGTLRFANNTKPVSANEANTQPLNGGRRSKRKSHRRSKRKSHRRSKRKSHRR